MYVPCTLKVAFAFVMCALSNVTLPGPATNDQVTVNVLPTGRPSSVAMPFSCAVTVGRLIVWSGPALTWGGWLTGGGVLVAVGVVVE